MEREYYSDEDNKRINKKNRKEVLKEVLKTSLYLLFVLVLTFLVIQFVGQRTEVVGSSMEPTLSDSDDLIANKISYRFSDPERFDIVIFPYTYEEDVFYIKRVIGLPGETVYIDPDGFIYINGDILIESYGNKIMNDAGLAVEPIVLGEDEYFVLGDNRNNSKDSRFIDVGNIHRSEIIGKTNFRIFPFSKFGKVEDK